MTTLIVLRILICTTVVLWYAISSVSVAVATSLLYKRRIALGLIVFSFAMIPCCFSVYLTSHAIADWFGAQ